jgi:hypothetical protein
MPHESSATRVALLAIALASLLPGQAPCAEVKPETGIRLRVGMDRRDLLPGEPVVIGLTVENRGTEIFEDLATLNPSQGFVGLVLTRDGENMPWSGRTRTLAFTEEGARLSPGDERCDVFDLLDYFGSSVAVTLSGAVREFPYALPPGEYVLRTRFEARFGIRRDLTQVFVEGNEMRFAVGDVAAIPDSEVAALDLLHAPGDGNLRWEEIRARGLHRSRYLISLLATNPPGNDFDAFGATEEYVREGGGVFSAAILLRLQYGHFGSRLRERETWIGTVRKRDSHGRFACFFRMWEEAVARGLRARSYGAPK